MRAALLGVMTAALAVVNVVGVRTTTFASNVLTVAKLLPLLTFVAVGAWMLNPGRLELGPPPPARDFSMTVLLLVHAFAGFESVGIPAGEVGNPRRDVPFALLATVTIVAILYIAIQAVCIGTLPELAAVSASTGGCRRPHDGHCGRTDDALRGHRLHRRQSQRAGARHGPDAVCHGGARPALLRGVEDPRTVLTHRHRAILITAGVMLAFAVSGTFVQLATISVGSRLVVYGATCAALPVLRRRDDLETGGFTGTCGSSAGDGVAGHLCVAAFQQHATRAVGLHHAGDRRRRGLRGLSAGRVCRAFAMTIRPRRSPTFPRSSISTTTRWLIASPRPTRRP